MPLRSAISTFAAAPGVATTAPASTVTSEEFFAGKAAPELVRNPGIKAPAVSEIEAPAPKPARKPRTAKPAPVVAARLAAAPDVKAVRALLTGVESDMLEVKNKMDKAMEKFQPRLERLRVRHAELSAELTRALTR